MRRILSLCLVLLGLGPAALPLASAAEPRHTIVGERLAERLSLLGHRNWVVVADMAYPAQNAPGIETIYVGGDHLSAVRTALEDIQKAPHVRGTVYLDTELNFVAEADAPGVTKYRAELKRLLGGESSIQQPHEELIGMLAEAAEQFRVVVLKTRMTIPYTTVFIQLDCGYWSSDAEKRLRDAMPAQR